MPPTTKDPTVELIRRVVDEAIIFLGYHCGQNFPVIKEHTLEALEQIFQTKALSRQLALALALEAGLITLNQFFRTVKSILTLTSRGRLVRDLFEKRNEAQTQDEWMDLAERIDNVRGDDIWRGDPNCPFYEKDRITARIDEFIHLMRRRDVFELMFLLRGGLTRNKFGLLHEGLYSKAMAGTKVLVETYHNVVCASLDFVCDAPIEESVTPIPTDAKLAFFNETRHAYGRTALLLSGGGALGMYHTGVVKALMENRLLPRVLSGASAGSIIGGILATRTDEECKEWFRQEGTNAPGHSGGMEFKYLEFLNLRLEETEFKESDGFVRRAWKTAMPRVLRILLSAVGDIATFNVSPFELFRIDLAKFREAVRTNIGEMTFQEAFDRTGRIMNVSVTPMNSSDPPRTLNYLTAPHVLIWSAAVASSSIPGVIGLNRLLVKDADGTVRYETTEAASFGDGSMEQDLPMEQLSEMFNVNHFIVSQVNPHAFMLSSYYHRRSIWSNPLVGFVNDVVTFLKRRWRTWLGHFVELVGARRFAPQHATTRFSLAGLFVQEYQGRHGDISLIPWQSHQSLWSAISTTFTNPSKKEAMEMVRAGERETWKHMPAIMSHIAEEVTLDRCVQRLRNRFLAESQARSSGVPTGSMGERVPSFFASPSLVNIGALNVTDQARIESFEKFDDHASSDKQGRDGNPAGSGTTTTRPSPAATTSTNCPAMEQLAGEETTASARAAGPASFWESGGNWQPTGGMAHFYYRNSSSHGTLRRTLSGNNGRNPKVLHKRQSISNPDLLTPVTRKPSVVG